MATYVCDQCRVPLTFRPVHARQREYCFAHSDDFRGCDVVQIGEACLLQCGGHLHVNQSFPATGIYRLPPGLRQLKNRAERLVALEQAWQNGIISVGDRDYLESIIEELAEVV